MFADIIPGSNISPCGVVPVNPPILPPGPRPPCSCAGPTGPTGATGAAGPIAATVPFSISKNGVTLITDAQGAPLAVAFSGFGSYGIPATYLTEGEWASGTITFQENMANPSAFILPYSGTLRSIYAVFSTTGGVMFADQAIIRPFVCLAVSQTEEMVFTILQDTMTFAEPYIGGVAYPKHTVRRGSLTGLNINIAEGALVGIVAGIMAENITVEQVGALAVSGGLYLQ